jgi:hypothetical protein
MDNIDSLLDLPIAVHVAALCFVVCTTTLFVMLIASPRRNCFFFRCEFAHLNWPTSLI